ncbi:unnamed protein product [Trichobilharzia regenti]|nr:unnamed protein product [Trichobilharzia regenti]
MFGLERLMPTLIYPIQCKVEIDFAKKADLHFFVFHEINELIEVYSPRTWLMNRDQLCLTVEAFGVVKRTRLHDAIFPLLIHEKFSFDKGMSPRLEYSVSSAIKCHPASCCCSCCPLHSLSTWDLRERTIRDAQDRR